MPQPRILVADDDADLRATVAEALAAAGMKVREVSTGAELLATLAQGGIDLVVTDVMMPDLGGVQAAAMARSAGVEVPILVMTGRLEEWVAQSVRKLQRADVVYKPFGAAELVERVHALLTPGRGRVVEALPERDEPHLFPPALVPILRRSVAESGSLDGIGDDVLTELLSVIFFAGLEHEEGQRNAVRVVFVGDGPLDAEPAVDGVPPALFRWSTLPFSSPRGFSTSQLVKLAAATVGGRVYVQVCHSDGRLLITGLAREGVNLEGDAALKIVVHRPGGLSIRVGRQHAFDYEHGRVQSLASDVILSGGPVREALERAALACGLSPFGVDRYLEQVSSLVASLSAHGSGGILVLDSEEHPSLEGDTGYRTRTEISLAAILLRLLKARSQGRARASATEQDQLVVGTLQSELQHTVTELGALTALDGATILDRTLSLVGFGVVLPVSETIEPVFEAIDAEALSIRRFDLGSRGTRHRAAATYASTHPGSVVFVASQDGTLGCLFRADSSARLILWRLGAAPGAMPRTSLV